MGGIAVLLLIAAGGITYGWKPDNDGGVEYVIQIPPDQVHELSRVGQISSSIDPAVRGRVSRVVIQVGEGPVPKITPPQWNGQDRSVSTPTGSDAIAGSDAAPMPIPEMPNDAALMPIAGIETVSNQAVMKPQTGDPNAGSGFALPPSLGDPSLGAGPPRVDAAGREIGSAAGSTGGNSRLVIPPPATRAPNSTTLPPFAATDNGNTAVGTNTGGGLNPSMATVRPGGPSTDPTTQRDRNWSTLGQNPIGGPTTDPVNSASSTIPPRSSTGLGTTGLGATGLGATGLNPSDTFGRPPASVSTPDWSNTAAGAASNRDLLNSSNIANNFGASPAAAADTSNPFRSRDNAMSGYAANDRSVAGSAATGLAGRNTLTPAQIAAGAWSVDVYGNPIDREGRPIQQQPLTTNQGDGSFAASQGFPANRSLDYSNAANGFQTQNPAFTNPAVASSNPALASLGTPAAANGIARPAYNYNTQQPTLGAVQAGGAMDPSRAANMRYASETQRLDGTSSAVTDPPSLITRRSESEDVSRSRQVSQPVITWLLLISFVGNVYLMFWMKKLLMRYRDLVAAKRVSDSRAAA